MRIDRIRILGFKSFAEKTVLELDPGITAIVGPNGCGKSNVIDAVKWVLGEQKPSSLRAKEMLDVIFAGNSKRKPLGMAEVALVFDNSDSVLPVDAPEVVLTRRLFRSGESGYLLNGKACRLKDLREVLMDTGSGLDAFSIMEQGKIDAILHANAAERRTVFEEAAGIGRFKARRQETTRRLDRIADDLTRLRDVIELTEKQLRSLRYQASRATRYRSLSEDLRKKRVTWALYRYHALLTERGDLTGKLEDAARREEEVNRELREILRDLGGEESSYETLGQRLGEAEAELIRLEGEIRSARERGEHGRRMAKELEDRVVWYENEIRVGERRTEDLAREREELSGELTALGAEASLRESELSKAEEAIETVRGEESELERGLAEVRRRKEEIAVERTFVRNERSSLATELRGGEVVTARIERRLGEIASERKARHEKREAHAAACGESTGRESDLLRRVEEAEGVAASLEAEIGEAASALAASDMKLSAWRSRLELLTSLKERREGMGEAVRRLLEEAERAKAEGASATVTGIRGVVAELIEVSGPDAPAVELALGACAQGVVTETIEDALRAITWLKERGLGRALFLPLDQLREAGPTYGGNGIARCAAGVVRAEGEYDALVRALLSDSVLVEDVDRARAVTGGGIDGGASLRIVTGGGEVFGRIGNVTGGRIGDESHAAGAFVSRNAEIAALGERIRDEEERRSGLDERLVARRATLGEARDDLRSLREALRSASRDAREAEARLARLDEDLERFEEEVHVLEVERSEIAAEREAAATRREALEKKEAEHADAEEEIGRREAEVLDELAAVRERRRAAEDQRTEVRVVLAAAKERVAGADSRLSAVSEAIGEAGRALELARVERGNCERRRDEATLESEVADRDGVEAEGAKESRLKEVGKLRKEHEAARETLLSRRQEAEELRERHDEYRTNLEDFRFRENEIRVKLEGLIERIQDELDLDLVDLYEGFIPEEVDWDALDREVTDLKQKIDRLGNVNLEAIDQLEEVEQRVEFLNREEADLLSSREQLTEILRKVNRESRERFETAFAEIRDHFRVMFRKLFGGGSADIRLSEGEDILDAGIEIVCKPPGRELRNLNLLSGGEKTLTAVALLFAIFKARPSPFALMDEVDAALDEKNIDRFLTVLREFSAESQFVIITHNKRTMVEADALYGVSMPEAGVSRPMSIRFDREGNGRSGGNGSAKPEAGAPTEEAQLSGEEAATPAAWEAS